MWYSEGMKAWLLFVALFIGSAIIYSAHVYKVQSILWGDTRYYFAYTRSLAIDHDLNFDNEAFLPKVGFPNQPLFSPKTNRVTNKFSPGAPLLWLPSFVLGEGLTWVQSQFMARPQIMGYGWLTLWVVGVSTVGFSVIGLWFFYLTAKNVVGKTTGLISSAVLLLTTQLFFYTAIDPLNSHSASFAVSAILLYFCQKWLFDKQKLSWKQVSFLGLLAGLLALIRNQDVVFCVPIGLSMLLKEKERVKNVVKSVLFGLVAFLPITIQLYCTNYLYGQLSSGYTIGGEQLNWFHPDFGRILLSQGNGFLFFAPIVFFFLFGLLKAAKYRDHLAQVGLISFVLSAYVIASWGPEILGGPYGSRMFTSSLPWLGYGGAMLLKEYFPDKSSRIWIFLLIFICLINTMGQTVYMLLKH